MFCFMADDQPCRNLDQALDRYASIAPAAALSGPTSFAPLIRKAIEIVEDSRRQYHCLVIIADGQVRFVHHLPSLSFDSSHSFNSASCVAPFKNPAASSHGRLLRSL